MKVAMEIEVSIAANSTNENVLSAAQYKTVPFNSLIRLLDTGSAAGLRRGLTVSGTSIINRGVVSSQNRVPLDPDDTVVSEVEAFQGQELFLSVENTTAGALTYRAKVWLESAA